MNELFCVIHKNLSYSPERTADFLAVERCVSRVEAAAAFKKNPGFLLEKAELGKASAFNLRASAFGFETLLLSQTDLRIPPPASVLSKIEFEADGFCFFSNSAKEHLPFSSIKAVIAGAYGIEKPPTPSTAEPGTGLMNSLRARYFPFALPLGDKHQSPSIAPLSPAPPKETVFRADILTSDPVPLRLTINCDEHDYSGLGAKKTLSSFENFRLLMEELSPRAYEAVKNPFLQTLLDKNDLSRFKYPSADAYEKELVWINTVRQ